MPIKGLFNNNKENESLKNKIAAIEQSIKRLSSIEVHLKRILQMENELNQVLKRKDHLNQPVKKDNKVTRKEENMTEASFRALFLKEITPFFNELSRLNEEVTGLKAEFQRKVRQKPQPVQPVAVLSMNESRLDRLEELVSEMQQKLAFQDERIRANEEWGKDHLNSNEEKEDHQEYQNQGVPPVIFHEYKIEKVIVEKYEVHNEIAQLGIKELGGQLNIGATYGVNPPPEIEEEESGEAEGAGGKPEQEVEEEPGEESSNIEEETC